MKKDRSPRSIVHGLLGTALLLATAVPGLTSADPDDIEEHPTGWTVSAGASSPTELEVVIHVLPKHYIYKDKTSVELTPASGAVKLGEITFPEAKKKKDPFLGEEVEIFETGDVKLVGKIALPKGATGLQTITASVRSQACTTRICKMPTDQTAVFKVVLGAAKKAAGVVDAATQPLPPPAAVSAPTATAPTTIVSAATGVHKAPQLTFLGMLTDEGGVGQMLAAGFLWALFFCFVGGLAVNLTPCVYPLIPITVSVIGASGAKTKSRAFVLALCYALGMSIINAALGLVAGMSGMRIGFIFQYTPVVIGVSALFVVLALGMVGVFNMQVPSSVQTKLNQIGGQGPMGVMLMGLVAGVVASPCSTPVLTGIVTVIVLGQIGAVKGAALMGAFSAGLGLPFVVLGTFSGLLGALPRSGNWMNAVKFVFGAMLMAAAFYFLKLGVPPETFAIVLGVASVLAGLYALFLPAGAGSGKALFVRRAGGVLGLLVGAGILLGGLRTMPFAPAATASKIAWIRAENTAVEMARTSGKPIIIDFFTEECIPCKELEHFTFSDPKVQELAQSFVPARIDLTLRGYTPAEEKQEIERVQKKYGVFGVPRVMFLNAAGEVIDPKLILTGFEGPEKFSARMQAALAQL